jgi:peptide/nickel transport system substrate-binding protein
VQVSKDGKTYTFKLRPGIKFHNGAPLTSADVVWSWKRYLDPNTKWLCLSEFDGSQSLKIESVEATDPMTVVFKLNQARPLFLTQIASFQCGSGAIIHKDSVNADGSWKAPIGTGPVQAGRVEARRVDRGSPRSRTTRARPARATDTSATRRRWSTRCAGS